MTTSEKCAAACLLLAVVAGTVYLFRDGVRAPAVARQAQGAATRHARVRELSLPRGVVAESFDRGAFRRYAKADVAVFDLEDEIRLGDEIRMTLFEALRLSLVIERQMKTRGRHRVFLASSGGREGAHAVILQKKDGVIMHVTDDATGSDFLWSCHPHVTWIGEYGNRLVPVRCGNGVDAPLTRDQIKDPPPAEKLADGSVTVDVLVAQDARAVAFAAELGLTHEEYAELALQNANVVLEQSGLLDEFSFRLVHTVDLGGSLGDDLGLALSHVSRGAPLNGVDLRTSVHLARDTYGADVVVALMDGSADSLSGISQGLSGYSYLRSADSEQPAHCVCDMQAAMTYTLAHELGHLLGAGHSDQQEMSPGPQLFEFSAGCYGGDWHSVMSYAKPGHPRRIGRFSSPELSGDDGHDNVQTLRLTYARVSNYRKARNPASIPVARGPANPVPDLVASVSETTGRTVVASAPETARVDGGAAPSADAQAGGVAPKTARRRKGRPTVTLEQFRQFVQGAAKDLDPKPIVAGVPRGSVLNIDTTQVAREFQSSHPEVVEVLTDFLPDGVSLEQLSSGRIVPEDRRDPSVRKSGLVLKVDEDGILSGKFRLIFRDAEGQSSVDVKVIGRVMEGESAGVASIDGDDAGPWYLTIAPDETAGEEEWETPPAGGTESGAQDE